MNKALVRIANTLEYIAVILLLLVLVTNCN